MSDFSTSMYIERFQVNEAFYTHSNICCYTATEKDSGRPYICKVYSCPAKITTTEAFLYSGAFASLEKINTYYKEQARELYKQGAILNALSHSEYFTYITFCQIVDKADIGYDIWFLSPYRRSLAHILKKTALPRDIIITLGCSLCRASLQARDAGFLYVGIKPENIFISDAGQFQIGDVGFFPVSSLSYLSLPESYQTVYTPKDCHDSFAHISVTTDVYSIGAVMYHALTGGKRPSSIILPPATDDHRLSEIIMKACDPNDANRWRSPAEMEQALLLIR